MARFTLTWITWKTSGILCYTCNFWYDKSIYAGFDTVTAVSRTSSVFLFLK